MSTEHVGPDPQRRATGLGRPAPAEAFASTPVHRLLGFTCRETTPERCVVAMSVRHEHLQETGVVQGGILTSLADTAAVHLLWPFLPADRSMIGTDAAMHFLAAAHPDAGELLATATALRRGGTLAVVESVVTQGDRLVAKGTFTFLLRAAR